MKERPILFNAEMVQAILSGRKTQTRRVMKDQPTDCFSPMNMGLELDYTARWYTPGIVDKHGYLQPAKKEIFGVADEHEGYECPIGAVGDQLWVRETFATLGNEDGCAIDWQENLVKASGPEAARVYRASCEQRPGNYGLWSIPDDAFWKPHTENMQYEGSWVPSIHMPRWASRINLLITGVRVERLNSITNADAKAEGYPAERESDGGATDPWLWFRDLWDGIYPDNTFKANPWVWVIEFERIGGDL